MGSIEPMLLLYLDNLDRFRARDDFNQFLGDLSLPLTVVTHRQLVDHFTCIAGCIVHS